MTGKKTKTCFRSYTAWQYQEEVDWMNKMAAEGWALERTNGFVHHFSRCEPGAWIIRLDRPSFKMSSPEGQEYLAMLHDFGAEWVGGVNGWIYLRRRADQGDFELYSDLAGKEHLLLRARSQMLFVLALALVGWLGSLLLAICSSESFMAVYPVIYLSIPIAVVHGLTRLNRQLKAVRQERQLHE